MVKILTISQPKKMPVNNQLPQQPQPQPQPEQQPPLFDPYDEDSWFFGSMSRDDASKLLSYNNETGAFLVRESSTKDGALVLSVRENKDKVSHYIINKFADKNQQIFQIGDQMFLDMPNLLSFYQRNNLDDTPLKVPAVPKDKTT